jgi:hypothetical protein
MPCKPVPLARRIAEEGLGPSSANRGAWGPCERYQSALTVMIEDEVARTSGR